MFLAAMLRRRDKRWRCSFDGRDRLRVYLLQQLHRAIKEKEEIVEKDVPHVMSFYSPNNKNKQQQQQQQQQLPMRRGEPASTCLQPGR